MGVFSEFLFVILLSVVLSLVAYLVLSRLRGEELSKGKRLWAVWADRAFLVVALSYIGTFTTLAILRYLTFHTGYLGVNTAWDLGQYGQLIWNSLNGRLLEGTFVRDTASFLGKSFTPILLAFVPLYAVWQSPIVLLIVQVVGLGLGGFPIYWLARQKVGHAFALAIALAYYLNPGLEHIGLTEFHEIALAVPLLAYAMFFLLCKHYKGFLVCLGLAFLVKEEIALIGIMFGVYIFLFQRKRWFGLGVAGFSAAWVVFLLQYLIPTFRGTEYGGTFYYFGEGVIGGGGTRYGYLGHGILEILTTLVTRPDWVLQHILIPDKIAYGLHLLVPLAFLPIIGIEIFTLTFPTFAYSLLSTYALQYEIRSYYFSPLLPFLFFAAILGLQRLLGWAAHRSWIGSTAWQGALATGLVAASVGSYLLQAPGPFARYFQPERYVIDAHTRLGNDLTSSIPSEAVVIGQNEFLAQLSNRQSLYEIPVIPDYRQADYLFADSTLGWYSVHDGYWKSYRSNGYFETVVDQDGYWIGKRKSPDHPRLVRFGDAITFLGYSIVPTSTLRGGMKLQPVASWRAEQPIAERYKIAVRLVDAQGHLWAVEDREPDDGFTPTNQWRPGKPVGDQYTLQLPPTIPAGDYTITIAVHPIGDGEELPALDETGNALGTQPIIGTVKIEKNKDSFLASDLWWIEQPLYVDMREMRFLGFDLPRKVVEPGAVLPIGLYWRARSKPQGDYAVAVELRDADGRVVVDQSNRPANGTYPTTQWDIGEVLLDWHDLALPQNISEGDYRVWVLLRDANTGQLIGETQISTVTVHR